MKKQLFLFAALAISLGLVAQPTVVGTSLIDGSYATHDLAARGAVRSVRLEATSTGGSRNWEFTTGSAGSPNYSTNWRPYISSQTLSSFDQKIDPSSAAASARYNTGFGGQSGLLPTITSGRFYTIIIGQNSSSNNFMSVLETEFEPVELSSVSHVVGGIGASTTVNITTGSAPDADEELFVRYSTDGFTTSSFVQATGSGTSWSAAIPNQTIGVTVNYYVLSSENGITLSHDDVDYQTLELNNNSGSNYSFQQTQVANLAATGDCSGVWSDTDCWSNSTLPTSSDDILIRHNITLDSDATISSLTISSNTFSASDVNPRTLTITRSDAGSATTLTNTGGTWANGSGGSTVVFSGSPGSGDAIHQTSGTLGLQNVTIEKSGGSDNVGVDFQANSSVSGTLEIGTGGYVSTSPPSGFYGGSATLAFNQGAGAEYDVGSGDNSWSTTQVPNNITISTGTVNLNDDRSASGSVTVSSGAALNVAESVELDINTNLSMDGDITLNASSSGYSQLKVDGTVSGSGSVTAEQYVGNTGWHCMSMPVSGNLDEFGSVNSAVHANTRNIYKWDESTTSWFDVAGATTGSGTANSAGFGYLVYVGTNGVISSAGNIDVSGGLFGSTSPSLSNSGSGDDAGWNLIGNPFPCGINFFDLTTSNVESGYSIWNPSSGSYSAYSDASPGNPRIPPMQAFWVKANGGSPSLGSISMSAHGDVANVSTFLKSNSAPADRIYLHTFEQTDPSHRDELLIALVPGTQDGADAQWDVSKRLNASTVPSLMSAANGDELAINAIDHGPLSAKPKLLQLRFVSAKNNEDYFIALEDSLLTNEYRIVLEDKKLSRRHDLNSRAYRFTHDVTEEYRFVLHLEPLVERLDEHTQVVVAAGSGSGRFFVIYFKEGSSAEPMEGALYDLQGRRVQSFSVPAGQDRVEVSTQDLPTGIYLLKIQTPNGLHAEKILID
jgi:hypothetical protein